MQKTIGDALERMTRVTPNILFGVGAGNNNQADDVQPVSVLLLKLPNLVIVGAIGTNDRQTSFETLGNGMVPIKPVAVSAGSDLVLLAASIRPHD